MAGPRSKKTVPSSKQSFAMRYLAVIMLAVCSTILFWHVLTRTGFFFGDFANYDYVKLLFHTGRISELQAPTWCSYHDLGRPIGQMVWHSPFYPLYIILSPFSHDPVVFEYLVSLVYIFQVFWAALGTYLLLRFWKISRQSALIGGISAGFCASIVITMTSANNGAGYGWLPWVMLGIEHMRLQADRFSWRGLRAALLTGAAVGLCFLISVVQRSLQETMVMSAFGLFLLVQMACRKQWALLTRFIVYAAIAAVLGFMISSVMVLPGLEYYSSTTRLGSDIYKDIRDQVPWKLALTNIIPFLFGRIDGPGSSATWNVFWGGSVPFQEYWNFWCRVNYTGLLPVLAVVLLPWWLWKKRSALVGFFACMALFMLLYMYGIENPLQYAVAELLPVLKGFRIPVRYAFFMSLPLAIIAAFIIDSVWPAAKTRLSRWFYVWAAVALGIIAVTAWIGTRFVPDDALARSVLWKSILTQLILFAAFCAAYLSVVRGIVTAENGKWLLAGLVFVDMFMFSSHINNAKESAAKSNQPNAVSIQLKKIADAAPVSERFRFEWDYAQANLRSVMWGLDSYNGYIMSRPLYEDTFRTLKKYHRDLYYNLLNVRYRLFVVRSQDELEANARSIPSWARPFAQQGLVISERPNALPRVWFASDARVLDNDAALGWMAQTNFNPRFMVALSSDTVPPGLPLQHRTDTPGTAELTTYDHTRMTARSDSLAPGYVVFSEIFYPGWKAYIDGKRVPVMRADITLRAIAVPAGTHEIEMVYEPLSFKAGFILYCIGMVIALAAVCIPVRPDRKTA